MRRCEMKYNEKRSYREKWKRKIRRLEAAVYKLKESNQIFRELNQLTSENKNIMKPPLLSKWILNNYIHYVIVSIRRSRIQLISATRDVINREPLQNTS